MASASERPKGKSLSDLNMVWRFAGNYPGHIICAGIALLVAAGATSGVPYAFKLIIDRGFSASSGQTGDISRWFQYLLFLVILMALATAIRFYFVSWLGERVVADIRLAVHRNLLRLAPGFFEQNRPGEITSRITVDTTIIEQVVGTTVSVALRNIVMGTACAVILFILAPKLAAMMLAGIALIVIPLTILGRRVR
ncbi:MAG TPA: ABC transporter transmembrane domain-containing protein, partial [Sphingomicrobium sp.]|nr:ABC transporter transmembrane domain-containing protein [Sphingomicrobium sp.]